MDAAHKTMGSNERITNMRTEHYIGFLIEKDLFDHSSESAMSLSEDLKQLKTGDLIRAFYKFREEMLSAIDVEINNECEKMIGVSDWFEEAVSVFQLLRECERRGLALDKF